MYKILVEVLFLKYTIYILIDLLVNCILIFLASYFTLLYSGDDYKQNFQETYGYDFVSKSTEERKIFKAKTGIDY